jgi:hypothetical protein
MFTRGGGSMIKKSKELKEMHEIMEKIYEEEKGFNAEQRVRKIKEESEKFMKERKLNLKRIGPKELKKVAI